MSELDEAIANLAKVVSQKSSQDSTEKQTLYFATVRAADTPTVQFDGSELVTPVDSTVGLSVGDRVIVRVENHAATVMGNLTDPSATATAVEAVKTEAVSMAESTALAAADAAADAAAAPVLRIDSSRGTVFKSNTVQTTLYVRIHVAGKIINNIDDLVARYGSGSYIQWSFERLDEERFGVIPNNDPRLRDGGFSFVLGPDDVDTKCVFMAELITN